MNPGLNENDIENDGADGLNTPDADIAKELSENGPELDITSETPVKEGDGTDLEHFANEMDPEEYDNER